MPATVTDDPLGIAGVFSDGSRSTFRLDGVAAPVLAADLLAGLAELTHPHGSVDAAATVKEYVYALRRICKLSPTGGSSAVRRSWAGAGWPRLGLPYHQDTLVRGLLRGFDPVGGHLDPGARALAQGRPFARHPRSSRRRYLRRPPSIEWPAVGSGEAPSERRLMIMISSTDYRQESTAAELKEARTTCPARRPATSTGASTFKT